MKSNELLFTLILQGHKVDPLQAHPYAALCGVRRVLSSREDLRTLFEEIWYSENFSAGHDVTPTNCISKICQNLGWTWVSPWAFADPVVGGIPLLGGDNNWWKHQVRGALRR